MRPAVSVVVPFAGSREQAVRLLAAFARLAVEEADEVLVVDNGGAGGFDGLELPPRFEVVLADAERSSYYARNRGAESARNPWILFVDGDCRPVENLIDAYFEAPPGGLTRAVGGRIQTVASESTLAARWATSRSLVNQARSLQLAFGPAVATGNMLVRRAAFEEVGGFAEGIVSGGDLELCWRLHGGAWAIEYRERAAVEHPPKATIADLRLQIARWAAGNAWQERHLPGSSPPPPLAKSIARALLGGLRGAFRLRLESARLAFVDIVVALTRALGRLGDNAAPRSIHPAGAAGSIAVFVDVFPAVSESFVASEARALTKLGWRVRIEAAARPRAPLLGGSREWRVDWWEDQGPVSRIRALIRLLARHPIRCLIDLAGRRHWPTAEAMPLRGIAPLAERLSELGDDHVHVHFAGPAATHGLRAGRLAGVPVSVAAHAYDIYAGPTALAEKLGRSRFVAASCDYTRRDLEAIAGPRHAGKVKRIVMGVDGEHFRRSRPYPGGRHVVAIGRYVEKKGFIHLLDAAALLRDRGGAVRLTIAGDGPLRSLLERRVGELGLGASVELPRAPGPAWVRGLLDRADLLAMPCVVAADGDRDSMPVVVKEALAMAVPVVTSDEVGLPEMVKPGWGRLVAPADPEALAGAIAALLELPAGERAEMGRAGRAFVLEHCDPRREAGRLTEAIRASASGGAAPFARR